MKNEGLRNKKEVLPVDSPFINAHASRNFKPPKQTDQLLRIPQMLFSPSPLLRSCLKKADTSVLVLYIVQPAASLQASNGQQAIGS